jgi:acyl carrier protein
MIKAARFLADLASSLPTPPASPLSAGTHFREQPWWDSLAALIVMASFQGAYGRQITAEQLRGCQTLGEVMELGEKERRTKNEERRTKNEERAGAANRVL